MLFWSRQLYRRLTNFEFAGMEVNGQPDGALRDACHGVRNTCGQKDIVSGFEWDVFIRDDQSGFALDEHDPLVLRLDVFGRFHRRRTHDPFDDQVAMDTCR